MLKRMQCMMRKSFSAVLAGQKRVGRCIFGKSTLTVRKAPNQAPQKLQKVDTTVTLREAFSETKTNW